MYSIKADLWYVLQRFVCNHAICTTRGFTHINQFTTDLVKNTKLIIFSQLNID